MSPSLAEELRVAIAPDRVEALRVRRGFCRDRVETQVTAPCRAEDESVNWRPAMDALAKALEEVYTGARTVRIVLADRFCRYQLIPWHENLRDQREVDKLARLHYRTVYGEPSAGWTIRVVATSYGAPYVACAVDADLVRALVELCGGRRLRIASIRPLLFSVYNGWFRTSSRKEPWFSVRNGDRFTLCRVDGPNWRSITTEWTGIDFTESLRAAVERDAVSLGVDGAEAPVAQFVASRGELARMEDGRRPRHAVDIDFGEPGAGRARAGGIALVAAGLVAVSLSAQQYLAVRDDVSAQEVTREDLRRSLRRDRRTIQELPNRSKEVQQEVRLANGIIEQMAVPWESLFQAIESAGDERIALLSIQPNVKARQVRIGGEAGSFDAILDYARRIAQGGLLDQVYLAEHAVRVQHPQQPIAFMLVARWTTPQ